MYIDIHIYISVYVYTYHHHPLSTGEVPPIKRKPFHLDSPALVCHALDENGIQGREPLDFILSFPTAFLAEYGISGG